MSHPHRTPKQIEALRKGLSARGLLNRLVSLCREYNVTLDAVLLGRRSTRIIQARDACIMKVLKVPMSTVETGELFGMHHTSVMAARVRYETRDKGRLLT